MESVSYSNFRQNLKDYMLKVNEDSVPLVVSSNHAKESVVVMSKDDYDSLEETLYIASNPDLVAKIQRGREQATTGQTKYHGLIEVDDDAQSMD